jgi:HAMP domain-containing protein
MLTFFATLLVNILIGTIFYLFISLRLEKSASELQVKKMRREMDEMIREFNVTAERNISLLENRIESMKRLLEKHGMNPEFDSAAEKDDVRGDQKVLAATNPVTGLNATGRQGFSVSESSVPQGSGILKKLGMKIMNAIHETSAIKDDMPEPKAEKKPRKSSIDIKLDEDIVSAMKKSSGEKSVVSEIRSVSDMQTAFALADNRKEIYSLLSQFYDEGNSVEELSRASGVPAGEISLVVSLNSRKG